MIKPHDVSASAASSVVHDFYDDTVVLITGGTGFIGKVLVEKMLRSFTIRTIYLLIRSKNSRSVDDRLHEFFEESVGICAPIPKCIPIYNSTQQFRYLIVCALRSRMRLLKWWPSIRISMHPI